MVVLNEELLRKRSEHNEGILADLEEICLHQQEIEKIECVGKLCKHLKILLLQNNVIAKIENLHKLKELEYLNLALNNIELIENLGLCESLRKLDLTVNFIDFDALELSISNLEQNYNLEDLYLLGNPAMSVWGSSGRQYIIARLPSLKQLDGQLISPAERISAQSSLSDLRVCLQSLAREVFEKKRIGEYNNFGEGAYTRESRLQMYRELGQQKADKERADRQRMGVENPKPPREVTPVLNSKGEVRQCNEGNYKYTLTDEIGKRLVFELYAPKYLDSSLIEVDLNPKYIRCVIKRRVTQVKFDDEIVVSDSKIERSRTSGVLKCTCPYENPRVFLEKEQRIDDCIPKLESIYID